MRPSTRPGRWPPARPWGPSAFWTWGLTTAYNIVVTLPGASDPSTTTGKIAKMLKEDYLDKGKAGINAGEGFYKYR